MEKVVAARLSEHSNTYGLPKPFQSAYRPHHSVESALIRVQSDILQAMDRQHIVVLVMLDLSAASTPSTTRSCYSASRVTYRHHQYGAPLASELFRGQDTARDGPWRPLQATNSTAWYAPKISPGPKLFSIYSAPLEGIIKRHSLEGHFYNADDMQLYFANPSEANVKDVTRRITSYVKEIQHCMEQNFLKLN